MPRRPPANIGKSHGLRNYKIRPMRFSRLPLSDPSVTADGYA